MKKTMISKRDSKRRLALERQSIRRERKINQLGSDSPIIKIISLNKRVFAAFVAFVIALSGLVVGFSFIAKAEEYTPEDKPVQMQVIVNDEWLKQHDSDAIVTVQFPSALIENGAITEGIAFQKKSDNGTVLVNSIQEQINQIVFGDQNDLSANERKSVIFEAAYVNKPNGISEEIVNVRVSDDNKIFYLTKVDSSELSPVTDASWKALGESDTLLLSFCNTSSELPVIDAGKETVLFQDTNASVSVKADGIIPEPNGVLPSAVKGLFKSPALKATTHLEAVDFHVLYNAVPRDDLTISVPAGDVEANMNSSTVKTQEEIELDSKAIWKKAVIWKWDSSENTYIQYEVKNVGKYEEGVYYSIEGDNEDTGILLGNNDKLYLKYELYYDVSYVITPEEGGNVVGSASKVAYGKSLPVNVNANTYYQLSGLSYNIQTGPSSYKYGTAQPVSNQTIPATDIVGDVIVYANYIRDTEYYIDANGIKHGHVCAPHSIEYSNANGGNDIAEWGDPDPDEDSGHIKHGVTVSAGGTAYLVMFAQKSTGSSDAYFLNAIWLNGEEIKVPSTYSYATGDAACSATTTLSNGSVITVDLVSDSKDEHVKNKNATRLRYIIKITDVKENIHLSAYFRPYAKTLMYLKGLRGIANTAAAYPVDTYLRYVGVARDRANNALYFLDENNSSKAINHMYSSYNTQKLLEQTNADEHLDDKLYGLGHNLSHFHFHNVYLVKVKPGYNENHIAYSDVLCNYSASIGEGVLADSKTIQITNSTTNSSFLSAYDTKDYYYQGVWPWGEDTYYYYCNWDTKLDSSNIATGVIDAGYYSVLTNEVPNDTYSDSGTTAAVKTYTPFLSGAKQKHYYKGIMLPELEYYNNSIEINSFAYKYKIQYFVNGQDQNGQVVSASYNNIDNSTHEFESGSSTFKEINRHAVEIASNPSSSAVANEFDGVVTDDVVIPEEPTAIDNDNYRYSFQYWKLVKCDSSGNYVSDVTKNGKILKFTPGETFALTNDAVGYYTAPASQLTGYNISLADFDVTSGDAASGYAWGDYDSADDNALTFTFMPVWQSTPIGDYLNYSVLAYKDTPGGALNDSDGNPITSIKDGKTYYLYYRNKNNKAAPNSEIVSLNQHYPTDGYTYNMNQDFTDEIIKNLVTEDYAATHDGTVVDDTIVYYYDVAEFKVTISEETKPAEGNPDYTSKEKAFDIVLTLTTNDGSNAEPGTYGDVEFISSDGKTQSTVSLASGESIVAMIPYGYKLAVDETDVSRASQVGIYTDSYLDSGTTYQESYPSTEITEEKSITVINSLVAPDIASGIMERSNPILWILMIMVAVIASGTGLFLWKKDVFVKR